MMDAHADAVLSMGRANMSNAADVFAVAAGICSMRQLLDSAICILHGEISPFTTRADAACPGKTRRQAFTSAEAIPGSVDANEIIDMTAIASGRTPSRYS